MSVRPDWPSRWPELGRLGTLQCDYDAAWTFLAEAVRVEQSAGSWYRIPDHLADLGRAELEMLNFDRAASLFEEALAQVPNHQPIQALIGLGEVRVAQGRTVEAGDLFAKLENIDQAAVHCTGRADLYRGLAALDRAENRLGSAIKHLCNSLDLRLLTGDKVAIIEALESLGGVAVQAGNPARGTKLLAAADARREACGFPRSPRCQKSYAADRDAARDRLSTDAFDVAWAQGTSIRGRLRTSR